MLLVAFREALPMEAGAGLLDSISEFCRRAGMAESTFGRRAVNDGKFVARLRDGARITPETLERVSAFLTTQGVEAPVAPRELMRLLRVTAPAARAAPASGEGAPSRNFRFFDNRQKYLLFVNTCSEKEVVARRVDSPQTEQHGGDDGDAGCDLNQAAPPFARSHHGLSFCR